MDFSALRPGSRGGIDLPSFDGISLPFRRKRRGPLERLVSSVEQAGTSEVPVWALVAAVLGGAAIGVGVGMWLTARRAAGRGQAGDLTSSADEIKAAWPEMTDADIKRAHGNAERLAELIHTRTGQSAESVRDRLAGMTADGNGASDE